VTYKTGQMSASTSIRPCGINIFKTLRLRYLLAKVTWHAYSMDRGTKLRGSRILNFGSCATLDQPELSPVGRDDPTRSGCLFERGKWMKISRQHFQTHGNWCRISGKRRNETVKSITSISGSSLASITWMRISSPYMWPRIPSIAVHAGRKLSWSCRWDNDWIIASCSSIRCNVRQKVTLVALSTAIYLSVCLSARLSHPRQ